jgi:hypothetical protein
MKRDKTDFQTLFKPLDDPSIFGNQRIEGVEESEEPKLPVPWANSGFPQST